MNTYAILMMLRSCLKFNPAKSSNVYAYMEVCCHSACAYYLNREKKQYHIKEELADRVLNGQIDKITK